ncbi:hypothetical protein BLNAU_5278 [Blattamonas nauphoetae]|uniref:Uncharacterized protein n=1 Tax=Blattamonas nauphoetae TaxID=2049346 RepID=A0ABQ9XDH4_9EUKA|nr:hypothetical protein BLNAU_22111 [Blattamonas nauphoetae]KAK2949323.1 hypothetical protein BLNAU_15805 [Blattamonas nauphoetae]KAK2956542.1 hypothetical protein BLNAU_8382 [Blattamonas nauphoetae]KAK2959789.1 hypothetical protein BLNAU_5278 [Blattamonas nauphoetae]
MGGCVETSENLQNVSIKQVSILLHCVACFILHRSDERSGCVSSLVKAVDSVVKVAGHHLRSAAIAVLEQFQNLV